jgi:outer membrane autotransporter protein
MSRANGLRFACIAAGAAAGAALLCSAGASAAPPSIGTQPIDVALSDQEDSIINLRQLGVVAGSAPLQVSVAPSVFVDGRLEPALEASVIPTQGGAVCVLLHNKDVSLQGAPVFALEVTVTNANRQTVGPVLVPIIDTRGAEVDLQDSQASLACSDPNTRPVANAGNDQNLGDTDGQPGENVTLNAAGSTDADVGTVLSYVWSDAQNNQIAIGVNPTVRLPDGPSTIRLTVTDDSFDPETNTSTGSVTITVTAPIPNALPVANAGPDQAVPDSDREPGELITLNGAQSSDPNGTITGYQWFLGQTSLGAGATLQARLPDGVNLVTLVVTDDAQATASDTVQISVAAPPVPDTLSEIPNLPSRLRSMAQGVDLTCGRIFATDRSNASLTTDQQDLLAKCDRLLVGNTQANQVEALEEITPEDFSLVRTQTLLFANTQFASVLDRLMALRGGARGMSLAGLNITVDGKTVSVAQLQDMIRTVFGGGASADEPGGLLSDKWGMWARGNYSFGEKDATAASPSFDADQWSLVGGIDYRLSENVVLGSSLSYGNASIDFTGNEGVLDTTSWALSAYGSMYAARNLYIDAIFNVADARFEAERNITYVDGGGLISSDASGETDGLTLSGGISGGYDFLIGGLTVSPNAGVFYIASTIDGFREQGAGGLNLVYDEQEFESLTANLGFRATYAWSLPWGVLLPHVRIDYVREFEDDADVFGVRFAADPNANSAPPILVQTDNPDESYWRLAGGLSAQFKYGVSGYIEYQRLESFESISFQDVSMGLRFQRSF